MKPTRLFLQNLANKYKLELLGVVKLEKEVEYKNFSTWIENGYNAEMDYLTKYNNCREDPRNLLSNSKSALIFGYHYYQGDTHSKGVKLSKQKVAQYARLRDYHKVLRKNCEKLWFDLKSYLPQEAEMRITVDSAPLLERALASKTEKGFIGKNTLYIHPDKGSFLLLAEMLITVELEYDLKSQADPKKRTSEGGCGSCRRCQINCPTGALSKEYQLDANKCISYYTIEHRGLIPTKFWHGLKYYFFGCDICQLVCPYNRKLPVIKTTDLKINSLPALEKIALMDQKDYEEWFGGTPMTRAKKDGLRRNALISMCMNGDSKLPHVMYQLINDDSKLIRDTIFQINDYINREQSITNEDTSTRLRV